MYNAERSSFSALYKTEENSLKTPNFQSTGKEVIEERNLAKEQDKTEADNFSSLPASLLLHSSVRTRQRRI